MRAGRYETGSEGKFASRWRAKSSDALCAVLPKDNTALFAEHNGFQQKCPFLCGKGIAYVSSFSKIDKIVSHSCWDLLLPKYPTVYRREPESADF